MSGHKNLSRRELLIAAGGLGGLFAFRDPALRLVETMVHGFIAQARAEEAGSLPNYYVNVHMDGAPNRFGFDQILRASASDPALEANRVVATSYSASGGVATDTFYRTFDVGGIQIPWVWNSQVARGSGGVRPMSDLLQNMLMIRGFGTGVDGHAANSISQRRPQAGGISLSGATADAATSIFAAITAPSQRNSVYNAFSSARGLSPTDVNSLQELMSPFALPAGTAAIRSLKERYAVAIDVAHAALKAEADKGLLGSRVLSQNLASATALMKRGVSDYTDFSTTRLAQYRAAITESIRASGVVGISDMPIVSNGTNAFGLTTDVTKILAQDLDLRGVITSATSHYLLAEGLTVAEYAIARGFCRSFEIPGLSINAMNVRFADETAASPRFLSVDAHETGHMASVFLEATYWRSTAAALLEFVDALKSAGVFNQTVIHLSGDFGRTPRSNGTGSDHGYDNMTASVISGMLSGGPKVVGNIYQAPQGYWTGTQYTGSWGLNAPMNVGGSWQSMSTVNVAASIATMLNLSKNPWDRATQMFTYGPSGLSLAQTPQTFTAPVIT